MLKRDLFLFEALLDSMPVAVLALDENLHVRAANAAARALGEAVTGGFGGLVGCVSATAQAGGCGQSHVCADCVMRISAAAAVGGQTIRQREIRVQSGAAVERVFLLSAGPFDGAGIESGIRALLVVEDVTELHRMRGLIPICASCKSIRKDDEAWEQLEQYIQDHSHVLFTHSLCPDCRQKLYPDRVRLNGTP
jgi:hypothetical protein